MHNRIDKRLAVGAVFGLLTFATAARLQATPVDPTAPPAACTVTVRGDSVPVRAEPVMIDAAVTEAIGDSISASFPVESKIVVASVAPATGMPNAVRLTLNTSAAAPGDWTISLKGSSGACTGKVKVTPAAAK
jgi:hypothetical protein